MITKEIKIKLFKTMYKIRQFELNAYDLYTRNMIKGSIHLYLGQEAIAAATCLNLNNGDSITSTHRGHGHCIAKGADIKLMMAELLGKKTGLCKGKGGSMHIADPDIGIFGANGIVGGGIGIACGLAFSYKYFNKKNVVICFFGEGASHQGILFEVMNLASLWELPIIFLCENNHYALSTPFEKTSKRNIVSIARDFGLKAETINGNDVEEVYKTTKKLISYTRENYRPCLIEAFTYRFMGHFLGDQELYRSKEEVNEWKNKCPIKIYSEELCKNGFNIAELDRIKKEIDNEISNAIEFAINSKQPELNSIFEDIYS